MIQSKGNIPSKAKELVDFFKICKITRIVRKLNWDITDFVNTFGISEDKLFELGYGPIFFEFDNTSVIGLSNIPKFNSLSLWLESIKGGIQSIIDSSEKTSDFSFIDSNDPILSSQTSQPILQQKLNRVSLLKNSNPAHSSHLGEMGLMLYKNQSRVLFSQKLCPKVPGHLVITNGADILPIYDGILDIVDL